MAKLPLEHKCESVCVCVCVCVCVLTCLAVRVFVRPEHAAQAGEHQAAEGLLRVRPAAVVQRVLGQPEPEPLQPAPAPAAEPEPEPEPKPESSELPVLLYGGAALVVMAAVAAYGALAYRRK